VGTLALNAHAKINLCLRVYGRRADGFHNIDSIFVPVDLADRVELTLREGGEVGLTCSGPFDDVPADHANLAWRAAASFIERAGVSFGVDIRLSKKIPPGGGLGGGSSDAAAVLRGLNRLAGPAALAEDALYGLAADLGSDVPFFLLGCAARVRGRGELLERIPRPRGCFFLLVFPDVSISTAWAYGALGRPPTGQNGEEHSGSLTNARGFSMLTCSGDLSRPVQAWARELHNDFEQVVFSAHPSLRDLRRKILECGAQGAVMSGSGSTLVGVFDDLDAARRGAAELSETDTAVVAPLHGD